MNIKIQTTNSPTFCKNFSKLEQQVMKDVQKYSATNEVETCRILKRGKDITNRFELYETPNYVSVYPQNSKILGIDFDFIGRIFNFKRNLKNSVYIHSHTSDVPLSSTDVVFAIKTKLKEIIAVTPLGNYSKLNLKGTSKKKLLEHLPIFDETLTKYQHLEQQFGEDAIIKNIEALKIYRESIINAWKKFVEKTGADYSSNM